MVPLFNRKCANTLKGSLAIREEKSSTAGGKSFLIDGLESSVFTCCGRKFRESGELIWIKGESWSPRNSWFKKKKKTTTLKLNIGINLFLWL